MADQHADREHAQWSASSTERNWRCPGSLALTDGLPETTSEAADWGTCAHQIAEKCLRGNGPAERYIGTTEKGKSHSFEVDEEMAETAQMYVDYVTSVLDQEDDGVKFWIEQKFSLEALKPPFDAGGTADAVIYLPKAKLIEVIDLKGGRGVVVEATGNPQGRTYALGAMLAHQGLDVDRVKVTIVQPRAPHKDGRIRSDEFHISDLVEWTTDLVAAMKRSKAATDALPPNAVYLTQLPETDDYDQPTGKMLDVINSMIPAEWAANNLNAGDHCKFCGAKAFCPAIEAKSIAQVGIWFEPSGDARLPLNRPEEDPVRRGQKLDMLAMIEGWIDAYRAEEHRRAEMGDPAENYVLVPAQKREIWNEGAEEQVIGAAILARLPEEKYLTKKLRTPKQVRKELGKNANLVADLSHTPSGGTNLVRADKTTRAPVEGTASRFFEPPTN
jgi:hypothetical protein